MMTETAIVILNWNGIEFLKKYLPLLIRESSEEGVAIVVADNGSADGSVKWLKENQGEVRIVEIGKNLGFAGGYNYALQRTDAKYYILINSDIEVTPGWITPLTKRLKADPLVAAVQPKILSLNNRSQFEHAGAAGGFIDRNGYPFCRGRILSHCETDNGQYDDLSEITWASGACMAIRADLFRKAGGFDDTFFAHMEEIDLCWRLKGMGYKIEYTYESVVYHVGGGTLPYDSPFKVYLNFRNNLFMLFKNLPPRWFGLKIFFRMKLDGIAAIRFLFSGEGKLFIAVMKAHLHFWRSLRKLIKDRKTTQKLFINNNIKVLGKRSILTAYYLQGKRTFFEIMR